MASISDFSRLSAILTLDIAGFLKNSEIAEAKLVQFGQKATRIGSQLSRGLGLAFGIVGFAAVNTASEFNKVSVQLRSLVSADSFGTLSRQARELGESTIFTRIQIAEAQKELAKLGTSGFDIENILPPIAALAGALDEDLVGAAASVKEALNIYSLEASESGRITDLYAQAVKSSALTIPQLREGLKNIGPILAQQNVSIEDSVALLALLANSAIKGSTAGTKLRSTFNKLAKTNEDGNQSIAKLTEGTFEYSEILELLNSRAAVVGSILNDQGDALRKLQGDFALAGGAADSLTEAFQGELFFTVEQTKNAIQNLGVEIGQGLTPAMNAIRDITVGLAKFFNGLSDTSKKLLGSFVVLIPVVSGLVYVVGQLAIVLAAGITPIGALTAAAIVLVSSLGALAIATSDANQDLKGFVSTLNDTNAVLNKPEEDKGGLVKRYKELSDAFYDGAANAELLRGELSKINIDNLGQGFIDIKTGSNFASGLIARRAQLQETLKAQEETNENLLAEQVQVGNLRDQYDYLLKTVAQWNAEAAKRSEAEVALKEAIEARVKVETQAQDLLDKARIQQLPDYQQKVAEINRQFEKFAEKIRAVGQSTAGLEIIRQELVQIAEAGNANDRAEFLEDLQFTLDKLGGTETQAKLLAIKKQITDLSDAAADLGLTSDQVKPLLDLLQTRLTANVYESIEDDQIKKQTDAQKKYTEFLRSELENRIQNQRDAVAQIVKDAELSVEQQRLLYEKLEDNIRELRAQSNEESEDLVVNQLRVVRDFANQIGNAFSSAIQNGTSFFKELSQAFLQFFSAIIGKLVALVTLYALLAALSGGTTAAGAPTGLAKTAQSLMGDGGLSGFISGGLGFRSTSGGGGSMAGIGSRIDGQDIVLSNQMSGRQLTRIGG